MIQYLDLLRHVMEHGKFKSDRTGTYSLFGAQTRFPLADGRSLHQLDQLIAQIQKNPDSRPLIVGAWNPGEIETMVMPPGHTLFQFYVSKGELSCQLYQRSADIFLGVPMFSHIKKCYQGVFTNVPKGFIDAWTLIALSLPFVVGFPDIRSSGASRRRQMFGERLFGAASTFCYN